jgi:hypothetical protein
MDLEGHMHGYELVIVTTCKRCHHSNVLPLVLNDVVLW